jgi:DNA repair exonuclease SbcCD ATPase subunit
MKLSVSKNVGVMKNKLILENIRIKNFLSVKDELYFDFLSHSGLNYVYGYNKDINDDIKNGVGKSTIFVHAVLFALYGKVNKINKGNLVNRVAGKTAEVVLNFSIDDYSYRIECGIKPTYCRLYRSSAEVPDEDITCASIKETYDYIENEILRVPFIIFTNSIILSNTDATSLFELSKSDREALINSIFNVSVFGDMLESVKKDYNTLHKDMTSERNIYNSKSETLQELTEKEKNFDKEKQEKIDEYNKCIRDINNQINTIQSGIEKVDNIDECKANFQKYKVIKDKTTETFRNIAIKVQEHKKEIEVNKSFIQKYKQIFDIVCTDCTSKLNTIIAYTTNLANIKKLENSITALEEKRDAIHEKTRTVDREYNRLEFLITQYEKNDTKYKQIEQLKNKICLLADRLNTETVKVSPYNEMIAEYTQDIDTRKHLLENKSEELAYLEYVKYILSEDGVKSYVLTELVELLNERISQYLEKLGCDYTLIIDNNFDFQFVTTTGVSDYWNFSSGERRRLVLATIFAIKDILMSQGTLDCNILCCDELFDGAICSYACDQLMKELKLESAEKTIFLISHRESISSAQFDNEIVLEKYNGNTSIIKDDQCE